MKVASRIRTVLALHLCFALSLGACGRSEVSEPGTTASIKAEEPFDEDAARDSAVVESIALTFEEVGDTSICTEDCGGHNAGFEWAKDNEITDESDCGGKSTSFIEGCQTYAQSIEEKVQEEQDRVDDSETDE